MTGKPIVEIRKKLFAALLLFLLVIITDNTNCLAAAGDSQIVSVSCPDASTMDTSGLITLSSSCTVNISVDAADSPVKLQIRVADNTTTKNTGNGGNLDITTPESRFFAETIYTVNQALQTVKTGITGNTTLELAYKTWEGDIGETDYTQNFILRLLDKNNIPVTQGEYSTGTTLDFTTIPVLIVTASSAPTITLTSTKIFTPGATESTSITVSVRANNTWIVKTKIFDSPIPDFPDNGTNSIPASATSFSCSGLTECVAGSHAFTTTYQTFAESNAGDYTTGTSDSGRSLSSKDLTATYTLTNQSPFILADTYKTLTDYELTSPKP